MRWWAGIAAVLMAGCGPGSDAEGFSRLAFLTDGNVHRTGGHAEPVAAVFTDVNSSSAKPIELAWMQNGILLSLYSDMSVARVDENPLQRLDTFDCYLRISPGTFRAEGDLLITSASGSSASGTGETQRCSFAIEPTASDEVRVWRFPGSRVSTNGDGLAVSCRDAFEGQHLVDLVDLDTENVLVQQRFESCPLLQPGGDTIAWRNAGRLMVGRASGDGEETWLVTGHGSTQTWSPDGRSLLVARGGSDAWAVIDATSGSVMGTVQGELTRWAKTSNHLLVKDHCDPDEARLRVFAYEQGLPERWSTPCGSWGHPALSPDGDAIAATQWEDGREAVVVVHRDGRLWSLGEGFSPTWQPG